MFDNLAFILTLGLVLMAFFWTITDPRSFNERTKYVLNPRILFVQSIEVILAVLHIFYLPFISFSFGYVDNWLIIFGVCIYLLGLVVAIFSKINMGKNWGIPNSLDRSRQDLVVDGFYKYSRNPMYLSFILISFGFFLALKSYFIFVVMILYFFLNKAAEKEERLLEKNFGKKYLDYKTKVPRFI